MAKKKKKPDFEAELCTKILSEWEKGRQYVSDLDDLYESLYSMLRGERPEKNYDWESNVVINKAFQVVWTAIPYFVQKIFGATPIVGVKSYDHKASWQREQILEFWHTLQPGNNSPHVSFFLTMVMWLLRGMLNGVGIVKKTWHQKLKTETKEEQITVPTEFDDDGNETSVEPHTVKRKTSVPLEDWPKNQVVNNKDIVTDWMLKPTQSIRQGRFVIHREVHDLESLYSSGLYKNLDKIDAQRQTTTSEDEDHATLKGKDGQEETPKSDFYAEVEIYERVGKLAVRESKNDWGFESVFDKDEMFDEDVEHKEMVCTFARMAGTEDSSDVLIRFEPNEYDEINYIDVHIYLDAERWNSIGMLEPAKDMFTAINDNINAMFDEIWQNLFPPVVVNKNAMWDWDTMQYAPRQRWLFGGGDMNNIIHFKQPSRVTSDAWQKHLLLDNEIQLATVSNAMKGAGKEKTATTNVLNAQLTADKLDFILKMIEVTAIIPSCQMDIRFAKKFAHPLTFKTILGEDFRFSDWEEYYRYVPAASSVKTDFQKEIEVQQDIQLIQVAAMIPNPNTPKILNYFFGNILRNRNHPNEALKFDESYFEPQNESGRMQMLNRMFQGGASNEQGIEMSGAERGVRKLTHEPRT